MELIDMEPGDRLWNEVREVYENSFPLCEGRSEDGHKDVLENAEYRAKIAAPAPYIRLPKRRLPNICLKTMEP